jgi:membrane associated rhomboid family serine protease
VGTAFFALIVVSCAALYFMKPEERKKLALAALARLRAAIATAREERPPHDAFHELVETRTPRTIAGPALIAIMAMIWFATIFSSAPDMQTWIAWGATYAPRTTDGEWGRLVTYSFVHAGLLHLLATIAALLPLGMLLERLVGRVAFVAVYLSSAVVAGVVSLWTTPATTASLGASGGVFGLYGLVLAVLVYGYVRNPRLPVSRIAAKRLAAGAAVFLLYNLLTDYLGTQSELAGLATGLVAGLVLARGVTERKARLHLTVPITAGAALLALAVALPMRGTIDARPAIQRIADVESHTASEYAKAVASFTQGRLSAKALAQVIQRNILPALEADRTRVNALRGVPREQTSLVTTAKEYFELREASWRRRIDGILASSVKILRDADQTERTALDAFARLQNEVAAPPAS